MSEKIIEIVNDRGKLHNPYTDTGGTLSGIVDEIGDTYNNPLNLRVGDEVVALISTTMIPLHIEKIIDIDFRFGFIEVEGYCIIESYCALLKKPDHISMAPFMIAMEETGSLIRIHQLSDQKSTFFIIGSNPMVSYLYARSIRKAIGKGGKIEGLICGSYADNSYENPLLNVYDRIYYQNGPEPLEAAELIINNNGGMFDFSINCTVGTQTEGINILITKESGTIFLSNISNHYSTVALLSESLRKDVNILCGVGYVNGYQDYNLNLLEECGPDLEIILKTCRKEKSKGGKRKVAPRDVLDSYHTIFYDFVYQSPVMEALAAEIAKASKYDSSVLIRGETGTGKEKIMDLIHCNSKRMMEPCVKVNCASIPVHLIESEFFGYEKGAFTGANASGRSGYFEMADKGILFLDEIGDLPLDLQAKFLRVLQDKRFYRIGGQKPIFTDVRIIAASNKDLRELVEKGLFREDLYYRIAVLILTIPPLRERKEDIAPLVNHLLDKYNKMYNCRKNISPKDYDIFLNYPWPGNIREMENLIQRLLINSDHDNISTDIILRELNRDNSFIDEEESLKRTDTGFRDFLNMKEKEYIEAAIKEYKTTRNAAAALKMTQSQFMRKKKKHGL
ncbi:MAG TPA: sigma-54 dependent transcriptional regulator [Bacillota bacterium]|nr:sigma-54 dependent transcriptional regulator [Bacillota bacterium]